MIDQITHEPEHAVAAAPGLGLVDQIRAAEQVAQLLQLPMDVSDDVDRAHHFLPGDGVDASLKRSHGRGETRV
jgi:hypothetical protein